MQRTFVFALGVIVGVNAVAQSIHGREGIALPPPPAVTAIPVADDYFGTKITDNYRWLEDAKSPATRAFIDAQNAYTAQYLKQARIRPQAVVELDALEKVSETSAPRRARQQLLFLEAPGQRTAVLDLCASRLEGSRRASDRSGQAE